MDMADTGPSLVLTAHEPVWVRLHGAHGPLIATLKAGIRPYNRRRYNEEVGLWEFHWDWLPQVVAWARRDYGHVDWADLPTTWQLRAAGAQIPHSGSLFVTEKSTSETPYEILCVTEEAPMEVVSAAYKALARIHHPDVGGEAPKFLKLAEAYNQIRKERSLLCPQPVDKPEDST